MKVISFGDTHGSSHWKEILQKETDADKVIFEGDYFDSKNGEYSANSQISNFKEIINLKREEPDKFILLFGNHDHHYLKNIHENYSGYQAEHAHDIGEVIQEALSENLLQMCYIHENFFFSHAGVTKTWCELYGINTNKENIEQSINDQFKFKPHSFNFIMGNNFSQTGDDICQSPIWVRPISLMKDMVDGYIFVVGHTQPTKMSQIFIEEGGDSSIILTDTLKTTKEYLSIIDGGIVFSKL